MKLPKNAKIVEVGPRDGLQNEAKIVPADIKIEFINQLSQTGLSQIEITSFVSPQWVPQMADNLEVAQKISRSPQVVYSALVPNLKGMELALTAKMDEIAIFTAASETFTKKNINCTIAESFERFIPVIGLAKKNHLPIRAYISCALGCPYEGTVQPEKVAEIAEKLFQMGCYEISLGDTIGVGVPTQTQHLISKVAEKVPREHLALHFHDTYGQALANIFAALQSGIHIFDSSIAGLGGCPYAPGAAGNVSTEDVVYMLQGLDIKTGINLNKLIKAGEFISHYLAKPTHSKVALTSN